MPEPAPDAPRLSVRYYGVETAPLGALVVVILGALLIVAMLFLASGSACPAAYDHFLTRQVVLTAFAVAGFFVAERTAYSLRAATIVAIGVVGALGINLIQLIPGKFALTGGLAAAMLDDGASAAMIISLFILLGAAVTLSDRLKDRPHKARLKPATNGLVLLIAVAVCVALAAMIARLDADLARAGAACGARAPWPDDSAQSFFLSLQEAANRLYVLNFVQIGGVSISTGGLAALRARRRASVRRETGSLADELCDLDDIDICD